MRWDSGPAQCSGDIVPVQYPSSSVQCPSAPVHCPSAMSLSPSAFLWGPRYMHAVHCPHAWCIVLIHSSDVTMHGVPTHVPMGTSRQLPQSVALPCCPIVSPHVIAALRGTAQCPAVLVHCPCVLPCTLVQCHTQCTVPLHCPCVLS